MKNDAEWLRAHANVCRRMAESRKCIGNEITCMLLLDYAEASDELAAMIDRDDERDKREFAAEAPTAPAPLMTQPGTGVRR